MDGAHEKNGKRILGGEQADVELVEQGAAQFAAGAAGGGGEVDGDAVDRQPVGDVVVSRRLGAVPCGLDIAPVRPRGLLLLRLGRCIEDAHGAQAAVDVLGVGGAAPEQLLDAELAGKGAQQLGADRAGVLEGDRRDRLMHGLAYELGDGARYGPVCGNRAQDALDAPPPLGLPPQAVEAFLAALPVRVEVGAQIGQAAVPEVLVEVGHVEVRLHDAGRRHGRHLRRRAEFAQLVHGLAQHLLPTLQDADQPCVAAREAVMGLRLELRREFGPPRFTRARRRRAMRA